MKTLKLILLSLAVSAVTGPAAMACNDKGRCEDSPGHNKPQVSVPEPGPLSMLAAGFVAIAVTRRLKK